MLAEKGILRKELIARRQNLLPAEKSKWDAEIFNSLTSLYEFNKADVVLTYVSTHIEVDTVRLITHCFNTGKTVAVPKCVGDSMVFVIINSFDALQIGSFGILQPIETENIVEDFSTSICIVPGLSFDNENYRIGYGKGYYDRFLKAYNGISAGIIYQSFIGNVCKDELDVATDIVLTNNSLINRRIYGRTGI